MTYSRGARDDGRTRDRRILFFGDSFVAGVGDSTGLGWVGRAVAAAYAAGRPLTAYNLGVRRDTSADVSARWRIEVQARMNVAEASYGVVFAFGANDTAEEDGRPRVEPGLAVDNLGRLVGAARELGLDVFVVGPPPVGDPAQAERTSTLSTCFAQASCARGVPYVETSTALANASCWLSEAAAGDGAHPGAGGYAELAEIVLKGGFLDWAR